MSARTPHRDRAELSGAAMILASALAIQGGAALATTTFDTISPISAVGVACGFAALFLLAVRPPRRAAWTREKLRDAVVLGVVSAVATSFLFLAFDRLPLGTAVTVQFLGPLALAIWTGRGRRVLPAAALALAGVALVSSATPSGNVVGLAFALVAAAGLGLYIHVAPLLTRHEGTGEGFAVATLVTALVCLPFSVEAVPELGDLEVLAALAVVGVLGRAIPLRVELAALRRLSPSSAGILFSASPAIAALVGALALGQGMRATQVLGILAVVVAGTLVLRDVPEGG